MSDKLVFEIDSAEAERHLRSLTAAAEQMGKTFKETKGATSALKELRQLLVGLKGQRSAFDELKSAIQGLNASAASLATGFERSIGQLGMTLTTELRSIRDAVRMGGLAVGQAATDGMSDGIKAGTKDVKKSIDDMGKQAVATSKSVAVAMNNALGSYTRYSPATGLKGSLVNNVGVASLMMNMPSKADFLAATAKAIEDAKVAQQAAIAQVKSATIQAVGSYSSVGSGRLFQVRNAELFMNMPSKADYQTATAKAAEEAKAAQTLAQAQVKAATIQAVGSYSSLAGRQYQVMNAELFMNMPSKADYQTAIAKAAEEAKAAQVVAQAQVKAATIQAVGSYSSLSGRQYQVMNAELFMNMPSKADYQTATAKAAEEAKAAQTLAQAQVKAATIRATGNYSSLSSGREFQIKNAELFMNMPSKAEYQAATTKMVAEAKAAQEAAIAQVRAATNATSAMYQRYNASTMTAGSMMNVPSAAPKPTELAQVSKGLQKFTIDANDAHSAARGLASGFGLLFLTWGNLIPLFAGAGISYGIKKTFDIGSEVEYQIKMMEVLGQTVDETGKQFQGAGGVIRAELRAIDQETQFSLLDLSKAMVDIQQQGRSTAEAISMLRPAAALASLGQTDLKTATNLLNSSLNAFSLNVAESGKVAAQLFQATKSAPLTIEDLSASIKYASEINVGYGQSLEEVLALLGSLSKVNLRGTTGGTSIINFMRDIAGRSGPAIKAMELLRKTTGDTLTVMEGGKFRPMITVIQEIGEALKKIEPGEGMRLLQKMTSDRGIRAYFASIREGTDDINKMRQELEKTSEVELFKAQRGLMDTTKGAFDVLKGAIVGALDSVFEGFADKFKGAIVDVTALISSGGFQQTVAGMVGAVMSLYEAIKALGPVLVTVFGLMAGWKILTVGIALFQGLAGAMVGVATASMSTVGGLSLSTTAMAASGAASLGGAAASKAAALGLNEVSVAAVRAGTTTAAAAGPMRALAVAIGFLNNPIVGVISALTLMAATYFISSNAASKAMGDTTKSVVDNGKINEEQWRKEIALLRTRQHLLGGDQYSGMEAELKKGEAGIQEAEARLAKLESGPKTVSGGKLAEKWKADIQAQRDTIRNGYRDIAELREQEVDRQLKAEADAMKKANDQMARLQGTLTPPKTPPGGKPAFEMVDLDRNKELQTIQTFYDQRLSVQTDAYSREKKIMDARRSGELLSEAQYMTQSYNLAQSYEDNQIALLEESSAAYLAKFIERYAKMSKAMEEAKSKEAKSIYSTAIEKEQNEAAAQAAKTSAAILKVRAEAAERIELTYINLEATAGKLIKTDNEFWNSRARSNAAEKEAKDLDRAYANINTSILSNDVALYAQAKAQAKVKAEVEEHNAKLRDQLSIHMQILEAEKLQLQSDGENPLIGAEQLARKQALIDQMTTAIARMKNTLDTSVQKGLQEGAEAGFRAFNEARDAQAAALQNEIGDAILQGITGNGKAAGKALRDILQRELLTKPLTAFIKGALSMDGTSSTGSGGASGGLNGLISAGQSIYGAFTGGISSSAGTAIAKLGETFGSEAIKSFAVGMKGSTLAPGLAGPTTAGASGAMGAGAIAGSVLNVVGGIGAGLAGGKMVSGGYSAFGGGSGNSAVNTGTAVGAAVGSIIPVIGTAIGAVIGGLIGGTVNRLFGTKLAGSGIQGTFGGEEGFTGNQFEFYKGGLFRSDKTKTTELDPETTRSFGATFKGLQIGTATMAATLGLGTQAIKDFTTSVKFDLKDLSEAEAATKIGEEFDKIAEALAQVALAGTGYINSVETAVETLTRLSQGLSGVNGILDILGAKMYENTLAGAGQAQVLINAAGGLEALTSAAQTYYDSYYSEYDRMMKQRDTQMKELASYNLYIDPNEGDAAKALFKKTVTEALDSGQTVLAAKLISMAGLFAQTADFGQQMIETIAEEAKTAADNAKTDADKLAADLQKAADDAADAWAKIIQGVTDLGQSASDLMASASAARKNAGALFNRITEAMGGDTNAYNDIRKQQLWAAMANADYEQQIELASELTDIVLSRYQLEKSNAEALLDFGKSLKAYVDNLKLGTLSPLTTGQKLAEAAKQYQNTLAAAKGGDKDAMSALQGISTSYLELARTYYASSDDYTKIFNSVTGALETLGVSSQTEAQQQLNISSKSLEELKKLQDIAYKAYFDADAEFEIQRVILQEQVNQLLRTASGIEAVRDILSNLPADLAGTINSGGVAGSGRYNTLAQSYVNVLGGRGGSSTDANYVAGAMAGMNSANWRAELNSALNLLTDPMQKQQMQAIFDAVARMQGIDGSHANGLGYVPFDKYIAELHQGERVLTAQENRSYSMPSWNNPGSESSNNSEALEELADAVEVLTEEVVQFREQSREDAGRLAQATFEAADANAEGVVAGVKNSAVRVAWGQNMKKKAGGYN